MCEKETGLSSEEIKQALVSGKTVNEPINERYSVTIRKDFLSDTASVFYYEVLIIAAFEDAHYCIANYRFPIMAINAAIRLFKNKSELLRQAPLLEEGEVFQFGFSLSEIKFLSKGNLHQGSHYDYLNIMLKSFWLEVFGKKASDVFQRWLVSSHGDKCSGYERVWEQVGINKYRGSLLYLLTHTQEYDGDRAGIDQWVIDSYLKYLPVIVKVENEVMSNLVTRLVTC